MSDYSTTVLFADLSGSVQLYESLGDNAAKGIVVALQEKLTHVVIEHSGIVQEIIGDELMCRFDEARHAIACAESIHRCTANFVSNPDSSLPENIQMRIGIHTGSAILEGKRLFGDTVNTAARITAIAQAGQTITTQAVLDLLPPRKRRLAREFDTATLKGKSEPMVVYDFPWQVHDLTSIKLVAVGHAQTSLELIYDGSSFLINTDATSSSLGRAINNFIVVDSEPVSRQHASIDYLRGRFVLSDKSTNGTYVYPLNGEAIYLRREQLPLWGKGRFCLGAPEDDAAGHIVEYCCETVQTDAPRQKTPVIPD